ncbi:MAG TPA: hypothetical protein PLB21_11810, partial [Actinomycetota bacterium]|nr:hypothetical protein [Actinomycetota bacterium]
MQYRKAVALVVAPMMGLVGLAACSPDQAPADDSSQAASGTFPTEWSEEITIDVFDGGWTPATQFNQV